MNPQIAYCIIAFDSYHYLKKCTYYIYFLKQNFSKTKAREETRVPAPRNTKAENTRMKMCKSMF